MSDLRIAETILQQLGGNRFIAMTGAKNFVGDDYSLSMTLPRNASRANRLKITLTPMDDYTMEFTRQTVGHLTKNYKWIEGKTETVKTFDGIYCDQLQELFTSVTGMYTHF